MTTNTSILNGDDFIVVNEFSTEESPIYEYQVIPSNKLLKLDGLKITSKGTEIASKSELKDSNLSMYFGEGVVIKICSDTSGLNDDTDKVRVKVIGYDRKSYRQMSLPVSLLESKVFEGVIKHVDRDLQLKELLSSMSFSPNDPIDYECSHQELFNISNFQIKEMIKNQDDSVVTKEYVVNLRKELPPHEKRYLSRLKKISKFDDGWYIAGDEVYTPFRASKYHEQLEELFNEMDSHHFTSESVDLTWVEFDDVIFVVYTGFIESALEPITHFYREYLQLRLKKFDYLSLNVEGFPVEYAGGDFSNQREILYRIGEYVRTNVNAEQNKKLQFVMLF